MTAFRISSEGAKRIRWDSRGSCGDPGCTDPQCCCAICSQPVGVSEDDPRWDDHDEFCGGCDLCRDQVPLMLFKGEGATMLQALFHQRCFEQILAKEPDPDDGVRRCPECERPNQFGELCVSCRSVTE